MFETDGDRLMSEDEGYSYEAFRKKVQDEIRIAERADISDIQTTVFQKHLLELKTKKANLAELSEKNL